MNSLKWQNKTNPLQLVERNHGNASEEPKTQNSDKITICGDQKGEQKFVSVNKFVHR